MSKYDNDEIQNYHYGSDLWAGDFDPILKMGVNDSVFWDLLNQKCPGFAKHLDCEQNRNTAVVVYCQRNPGQPIICSELDMLIRKLISIAYEGFKDPNEKPAEPVDTRPRDSKGRVMSAKAIRFRDWTTWVNSPETSMKQVQELRRTNPEFAEFYATMAARERQSEQVGDAVVNLNANRDPEKKKLPDEVYTWAAQCRTLPVEELRRIMSPSAVGSRVAEENTRLFNIAVAANLL
jgi:hypothetical protein